MVSVARTICVLTHGFPYLDFVFLACVLPFLVLIISVSVFCVIIVCMLADMIDCKTCSKNILNHQSWILCKICSSHYHTRCVYTDVVDDWFCFKCTGEIFPFNHYNDDDEFKFAISCFDNTLDFNRMLSLKLNPFIFEDNFRTATSEFDDLSVNSKPINKCSYVFNNDISSYKDDDEFSILHFNARSIGKNFDYIHNFITSLDRKFTVISISETWLKDSKCDLVEIDDYVLINAPRNNRRSGGSALYVHKSVDYCIREDLKLAANASDDSHSESIFVEIYSSVNHCSIEARLT